MRRVGFWMALTCVLLFGAICAAGIRYSFVWQTRTGIQLFVMGGMCGFTWSNHSYPPICAIGTHTGGHRWADFDGNFSGQFYVRFPLWLPVALAGIASIALGWPRRPKRTPTECAACGYDLRGQLPGRAGVRCPECGAMQSARPAAQHSATLT